MDIEGEPPAREEEGVEEKEEPGGESPVKGEGGEGFGLEEQ